MGLNCNVGGARGMFEGRFATEVADVLDSAFGAEGDWEGTAPRPFGELEVGSWAELRARASEELGADDVPNLLAMDARGRGVYLPTHVRAVSLPTSAGNLRCASLPGLRRELAELADRWGLPEDDDGLSAILHASSAPEALAFARLALAANEAARRDCPLWLVG